MTLFIVYPVTMNLVLSPEWQLNNSNGLLKVSSIQHNQVTTVDIRSLNHVKPQPICFYSTPRMRYKDWFFDGGMRAWIEKGTSVTAFPRLDLTIEAWRHNCWGSIWSIV